MAEVNQYLFNFKEVVEALIRKEDIREGIWGLYVEFGLTAANAGPTDDQLLPTAIVPIQKIGLQRMPKENSLAVDAAKVSRSNEGRESTTGQSVEATVEKLTGMGKRKIIT